MGAWEGIDEFVAVVECGGFSAAATALRASSSHISRQVAGLEDRLQARLLYRTTRRVSLTEVGRVFYAHCQRMVAARESAFLEVGDFADAPKGLLRMTCATAYGERFVMPLINEFMSRHPQVSVEVELTNRVLDLVQEGVDLAIRLGRLADSSLVAARLAARVMHLCAAPAYLAEHGAPRTLADLGGHQCLIGSSDSWIFSQNGEDWPFRPRGRWRCNSGQAVLDAALRGLGLCQLPDYYVTPHIAAGRLVDLLDSHRPANTAVWALYPQRRHLSPKVQYMIAHLRDGLGDGLGGGPGGALASGGGRNPALGVPGPCGG